MRSPFLAEHHLRAAEGAVVHIFRALFIENLPAVAAQAIAGVMSGDVAPDLDLADGSELLFAEDQFDILDANPFGTRPALSLEGTLELQLFSLVVSLFLSAVVGDTFAAELVTAVVKGKIDADDVLAELALRVDLICDLVDQLPALFDQLKSAIQLHSPILKIDLIWEIAPFIPPLDAFGYFEHLI